MQIGKVTLTRFLPVLFFISHEYQIVSGQRLLWLMLPRKTPQSQNIYRFLPQGQQYYYYGTLGNTYSSSRNIDSGNSKLAFGNFFVKNLVHDQPFGGPFYQRSTPNGFYSLPQIQHLFIKEDGSGSDINWQEHSSKRKGINGAKENQIENLFQENDNIMGKEDYENDDNASNSSSGSTELSLTRPPLPFHEDDTHAIGTVAVNVNVKCGLSPDLEGNQARYDPVTGRCFTVGTRGPCGNRMVFTALPGDNSNGLCECDYGSYDRPLVHIGEQCHFLYSQAMCYPGYWLTSVTPTSEPVCELNPCHNSFGSSKSTLINNPVVFFKGECVKLNSANRHCKRDGEVVLFPRGSSKLTCGFHPKSTKRIHRRQISSIRMFRCRPGEVRNRVTKKCVRKTKMYFI